MKNSIINLAALQLEWNSQPPKVMKIPHSRHGATKADAPLLLRRAYGCWRNMLARCRYKRIGYGTIQVCENWQGICGFSNFLADLAFPPSINHSIDRIDGQSNYLPGNCRWATAALQASNRSTSILVHNLTVKELCLKTGVAPATAYKRIRNGESPFVACTRKVQRREKAVNV
jgi:hypothetical protein